MFNHWRENKPAKIAGIPVGALIPFILLIYIPSWALFTILIVIITVYSILSKLGYNPVSFYHSILSKLRGKIVYSRPWWRRSRWGDNGF